MRDVITGCYSGQAPVVQNEREIKLSQGACSTWNFIKCESLRRHDDGRQEWGVMRRNRRTRSEAEVLMALLKYLILHALTSSLPLSRAPRTRDVSRSDSGHASPMRARYPSSDASRRYPTDGIAPSPAPGRFRYL